MVTNLGMIRAADGRAGGSLGEESLELLREVNTWLAVSETCITRGLHKVVCERDDDAREKKTWRSGVRAKDTEDREKKKLLEERMLEHERAPK